MTMLLFVVLGFMSPALGTDCAAGNCTEGEDASLLQRTVQREQCNKGEKGKCNFPFVYRAVSYNACTTVGTSRPWCAVTLKSGYYQGTTYKNYAGDWTYCVCNSDNDNNDDDNDDNNDDSKPCSGTCYDGKGVLDSSRQCGKNKCGGCCECTGECPPTEPPEDVECDNSCYSKKGFLNPSKKCDKDKCKGCCECLGTCIDTDDLEDYERGDEISDQHVPYYGCAKWCYSKKHKNKPAEQKCGWYSCSKCSECPDDNDDDDEDEDDDEDYGGDEDYEEPDEPTCLQDKCYNKRTGNVKRKKCESGKNGCALCSECDEEPEDKCRCEQDKCYDRKGAIKSEICEKNKCCACTECSAMLLEINETKEIDAMSASGLYTEGKDTMCAEGYKNVDIVPLMYSDDGTPLYSRAACMKACEDNPPCKQVSYGWPDNSKCRVGTGANGMCSKTESHPLCKTNICALYTKN